MEINIDKISNPSAERIILSNCINDMNILIECESEGLSPKHFAVEANRIIYSAIVYLFTRNAQTDAMSIMNVIKDQRSKDIVEEFGGVQYLLTLQQLPRTYNISMFIKELLNCHIKRQLYMICSDVQKDIIDHPDSEGDILIGKLNQTVADLTLDANNTIESYKMGDKLDERLQEAQNNPTDVPGLSVGWSQYDRITRGSIPGDLTIIVAESKVGKSATMLNWAKNIAVDQQLPILWIDTEQSDEEEELRLTSIISQVPEDELKTGLFSIDTYNGSAVEKIQKINYAKRILKSSQFHHVSMPEFTLEKIVATTRKFHLKYGIVALFFDYIKLNPNMIAQYRGMRTDLILTTLTAGLKALGGTLKIPVFTAAQENRTGYGDTHKDAKNIGESIGILQLATKLLFLRNKTEEELALEGASKGNQKLMIQYMRHGESGINLNIHYDRIRLTQREVR